MSINLTNTIVGEEIKKLRADLPKLSELNDDQLFNLVCFKYFYNNGEISLSDYRNIYTDGKDDGGIDFITTYEPDNQNTVVVYAQSKLWENTPGKRDIISLYKKIDTTVKSFKMNRKCNDYNEKLTRVMINSLDEAKDNDYSEELVVFIYSDVDDNLEKSIYKEIDESKELSEDLSDYKITIYFKNMIDNQITIVNEGRTTVPQDKICLYREGGRNFQIIEYGENGLYTTISALDLQRLYKKYRYDGLFEQNLRYYRPDKHIDNEIRLSISKNKDKFWYFNNGIIFACQDFIPDGDNIKLYSFSIINGGQTTALIGDYLEGTDDFAIPCKIIKGSDYNFLAKVAEASNSQKAISAVDLKANAPEQIQLKKLLEEAEIYLEIKKGKVGSTKGKDIHKPKNYNKSWVKIGNQALGQLLLSFVYQEPGTARGSKKSIFSSPNTYKKLFLNRELRDLDLIKSLIKLNQYINDYAESSDTSFDMEENDIIGYGRLFILAVIGFLIKVERGLIDYKRINEDENIWEQELEKSIPTGNIFSDYNGDDFDMILRSLFQKIIGKIKDAHNTYEPNSTYTNFLKTNPKYRKFILRKIIDDILKIEIEHRRFKEDYLKIFNI